MVVTANTGTSATIVLTVTEPILISPLVSGKLSNFTSSLVGIQNATYTCNFGNLSRLLSLQQDQGAPGVINITGVSVRVDAASLLWNYFTPSALRPIPRSMESSYFSLVSYPTRTSAPILPGGTVSITMQSVQLTSIPRRIYAFARRDDSLQTAFTSDAYFALPELVNPLNVT
jgi:hypothetical protein